MRSFLAMMRKEFLHIARDPQLIGFVLGLPILLLVLFGYALRLRPDNLTVAVWDRERTFFSVTVKDRLARAGNLRIVDVDSEETIREWLRTGTPRLGFLPSRNHRDRHHAGDLDALCRPRTREGAADDRAAPRDADLTRVAHRREDGSVRHHRRARLRRCDGPGAADVHAALSRLS